MTKDNHSLSARVFHKIRKDILTGKYVRNEELKEKAIGDELGVSRTPVREAFRQLELEGLISIVPNKGACVIGLSEKDVHDIYEIRSLLEGLCAKWAAKNITDEQLQELEENVYLTEFYARKANQEQMVDLDNKFHEVLYDASGSSELRRVLIEYHLYVQEARSISLSNPERVPKFMNEHKAIVEALKEHDSRKAEKLAKVHMKNTMLNMDEIGWGNLV
ncbi:GntR family transcriptional regulator [Lachnobacterium bovis]|uniref:DNA-binding transcriptional regulator, GntR family n=1 Tax=Lachnobacterium bovis TaxID=140626 RepID=A0A1H9PS21_9FIRM|nr:GntR family transcriptional regulator [Lachnobacterium bovis]SER51027.1 DNA-binding transcriptional regulator, GntR family [Lachnobacterium bovis]